MNVYCLPMLYDNYGWVLVDRRSGSCAVVDPGEAEPVLRFVREHDLRLRMVLLTHHHSDHCAGLLDLADAVRGVDVLCSRVDAQRIPLANRAVEDGEQIRVAGVPARVLSLPGHTRGSIAFYLGDQRAVFTGDTMFLAGCGRLFEGDAKQLYGSLMRVSDLPEDTMVYCGHEYTLKNLRFAASLEPDHAGIRARIVEATKKRERGESTVPGSLEQELNTNPFLRANSAPMRAVTGKTDPVEVFAELRRRRDHFD